MTGSGDHFDVTNESPASPRNRGLLLVGDRAANAAVSRTTNLLLRTALAAWLRPAPAGACRIQATELQDNGGHRAWGPDCAPTKLIGMVQTNTYRRTGSVSRKTTRTNQLVAVVHTWRRCPRCERPCCSRAPRRRPRNRRRCRIGAARSWRNSHRQYATVAENAATHQAKHNITT